jgi:hypothetical protein
MRGPAFATGVKLARSIMKDRYELPIKIAMVALNRPAGQQRMAQNKRQRFQRIQFSTSAFIPLDARQQPLRRTIDPMAQAQLASASAWPAMIVATGRPYDRLDQLGPPLPSAEATNSRGCI